MIADLKVNSTKKPRSIGREDAMVEHGSPPLVDPFQVALIVSSYVRHHKIAADQLAGLIVEVHRALASLGRAPPVQEPPRPAVPIRRSVHQDYIVCLECGFRAQMPSPTSADHARSRCRFLPHPLETPAGLPR
jgi:hypothetical protein